MDNFNFIFLGHSYVLPIKLKNLTRDQIEYCVELANNGDYDSVLGVAEYEFNLK